MSGVSHESAWVRVYGWPGVLVGGQDLRFASRKGLALLLRLALDGPQPREALARQLWTDAQDPRGALRNCLAQTNRVLRAAGLPAVTADGALLSWAFAGLVDTLGEREGGGAPWLDGFELPGAPGFADWAQERGAFHTARRAAHLGAALHAARADSDWPQVAAHAAALLATDDLHAGAFAALIEAHERRGLNAQAAQVRAWRDRTLPAPDLPAATAAPLAGRAREQAWLAGARGGVWVLRGPAGSGKSALLRTRPDAARLSAQPGDPARPYATLGRALGHWHAAGALRNLPRWAARQLVNLLPALDVPGDPLQKWQLFPALDEAARLAGETLTLDGADWLDPVALEWARHAAARAAAGTGTLILAGRFDTPDPDVAALLADLPDASVWTLGPLAAPDAAALLGVSPLDPTLPEVLSVTGGWPLHLSELARARHGGDAPRGTLLTLLERQLRALPPDRLALLHLIEVCGALPPLPVCAQVLGVGVLPLARHLEALQQARWVNEGAFRHDLIRQAARSTLGRAVRAGLGAAWWSALQARAATGEPVPAAERAQAAHAAGERRAAALAQLDLLDELYAAGFVAGGLNRLLDLLDQGALPQLDTAALTRTLRRAGQLLHAGLFQHPRSAQLVAALSQLALTRSDAALRASADCLVADEQRLAGREDRAAQLLDLARRRARRHPWAQGLIAERQAWLAMSAGAYPQVVRRARTALRAADTCGDEDLAAAALEVLFVAQQQLGRWQDCRATTAQVVRRGAGRSALKLPVAYARTMGALAATAQGYARAVTDELRALTDELGHTEFLNGLGVAQRTFSLALLDQGDAPGALDTARAAVPVAARLGGLHGYAAHRTLAAAWLHLGEPRAALRTLDDAWAAIPADLGGDAGHLTRATVWTLRARAREALGQGDPAGGEALRDVLAARDERLRVTPALRGSGLLHHPRDHEVRILWRAGLPEVAAQEAAGLSGEDSPRLRVLRAGSLAALLDLQGQADAARRERRRAHREAQALGLDGLIRQAQLAPS